MKSLLPEGWGFEGPDYDAGIMGTLIWHDDCPPLIENPDQEGQDPAILYQYLGHKGKGINRHSETIVTLVCLDCSETASYIETDWDPDPKEELVELIERVSYQVTEEGIYTRSLWDTYVERTGWTPGASDVSAEEYAQALAEVFDQ